MEMIKEALKDLEKVIAMGDRLDNDSRRYVPDEVMNLVETAAERLSLWING